MQKMSNDEYNKYVAKLAPKSRTVRDCCNAFWIGGLICTVGQLLLYLYGDVAAMEEEMAALMTSVTLVFLSALLTGLSVYDDIAKVAGAGTLVPITGFANAMVSPAMEFRSEGWILGMSAKMFSIAGPVLVYGISASVIYGIVLAIVG